MLLVQRPRSASFRRRAVSTAYYAVFHQLAQLCSDCLLPQSGRDPEDYARIYRALDHGQLKRAFGQKPLAAHETLRRIGDIVVKLQSERHRADYLPEDTSLFPLEDVRSLVDTAAQTVRDLNALSAEDRRTLASCLLFKPR